MRRAPSGVGWPMRLLLCVCASACGAEPAAAGDRGGESMTTARAPGQTGEPLDDLGLFQDAVAQEPAMGVIPYDVNSVLYADEVEKLRFLALPAGQAAEYDPVEMWRYPEGTRFIKTFYVPLDARAPRDGQRLIETRIIELRAGTWTGRTYIWDEDQTEARRLKTGRTVPLRWIGADGEPREVDYRVPNDNECKSCHSRDDTFELLGPRTRQLNRPYAYGGGREDARGNQIDHLVSLGVLRGAIEPTAERVSLVDPYGSADLALRARSYLDANCSHCHRPGGEAGSTALDLRFETTEPFAWGVCRAPVAAGPGSGGRHHDIVAGDPDASIMVYRMASTDPEIKMPELPTVTSDAAGTRLIADWIAAMPAKPCR
jgi:uncharacterized repeat protein (TIGR03806 family)